jgi:hypothetical protein
VVTADGCRILTHVGEGGSNARAVATR